MEILANTWRGIRPYTKGKILATFGLGMSSGFPLTLVISVMSLWLSYGGVKKSDVGLFALVTTFYTWKFLWSPAIDRLPLGFITNIFGQRRGWLFLIKFLMTIAIVVLSRLDPATQLYEIAVVASVVAFLSASLDIVIDAYRIEIIGEDEQGHSAASYVYGYRTANYLAAIMVLALAGAFDWSIALSALPLFFIPGLIGAWWVGEPAKKEDDDFLQDEIQNEGRGLFWER